MSKTKELIICVISIIALVLTIATNIKAADINTLMADTNNTNTNTNEFEQIPSTTDQNNTTTNNTTQNNTITNNSTNNTNTTTTIPYTGVDYSVLILIAICGVSAIYAYKKIRDYNV